jgi:D-ribose pyranose/furanose isomerase RbsD
MNNSSILSKTANLRQNAETILKTNSAVTSSRCSETEPLKLVHELNLHQIELELTVEELMLANSTAQHAAEKYTELFDFAPSGYFILSKERTIIDSNFSGAKMLCRKRTDLKNSNFGFFVTDDTKPIFNLFLEKVFNSKTSELCEVILSVNDNLPTYVQLVGIATKNGEECLLNVMNITHQKLAAELVIANKELAFQNKEKTIRENELKEKMEKIKYLNSFFIDRELRMIELKKEINELAVKLGEKKRYDW